MSTTVNTVRDIVPKLREAFRVAQSGTPGPVFVELPIDILYPYSVIRGELLSAGSSSKGLGGKLVNFYLSCYAKNLFGGAFDRVLPSEPLSVDIPFAKSSQVQKAADLLSNAKNPLIILGSQAVLPPVGGDKLRQAIEVRIMIG